MIGRDRSAAYAQAATEKRLPGRAGRGPLAPAEEPARGRRAACSSDTRRLLTRPPRPPKPPRNRPATRRSRKPARRHRPSNHPPLDRRANRLPGSPRLQAEQSKRQQRIGRFEQVHELHRRGHSASRIARELGLSRRSVFRYLRRETRPAWGLGGSRRSRLDGYRGWIDARLAEGFTNVAELHRRLTERGFKGSYGSVYEFVTQQLGAGPEGGASVSTGPSRRSRHRRQRGSSPSSGPAERRNGSLPAGAARRHPGPERRAGRGAGPGGQVRRPDS